MDCPGPIAATAGDLAMLFGLMGGDARQDADPRRLRVGIPGGVFAGAVHDEVRAAVRHVGETLESLGAVVESSGEAFERDIRGVWIRVCTPEFAAAHPEAFLNRRLVDPSVMDWLDRGAQMTEQERKAASLQRREIRRRFMDQLERFDVLAVPTTPYPAPHVDEHELDLGVAGRIDLEQIGPGWLTCSVNLANLPAVNLPAAWSSDGLPIGVSLVGRPDGDGLLLGLAARWEEATAYRPRRPTAAA
jgi:aspartyl-tRNA(Asn)/glutamyl-tRNA(Gln) amidotransferase subunit A